MSGCSLRNVLNIALQAVTSSHPELAEDEAYLPFPKGEESVDECNERSVLGPKTTFHSCLLSHKYKLSTLYETSWRTVGEKAVFPPLKREWPSGRREREQPGLKGSACSPGCVASKGAVLGHKVPGFQGISVHQPLNGCS